MTRVYIPKFGLVESARPGKNFYVYTVEVCHEGKLHTLEKRYSAFHSLYKELQKNYDTGEFPPKSLRNTSQKVLEMRRFGLESWLQSLVRMPRLPPAVVNFLQITNYDPYQYESCRPDNEQIHRPILTFSYDPYLDMDDTSSLPDDAFSNCTDLSNTVVKGVITALYDSNFEIPS